MWDVCSKPPTNSCLLAPRSSCARKQRRKQRRKVVSRGQLFSPSSCIVEDFVFFGVEHCGFCRRFSFSLVLVLPLVLLVISCNEAESWSPCSLLLTAPGAELSCRGHSRAPYERTYTRNEVDVLMVPCRRRRWPFSLLHETSTRTSYTECWVTLLHQEWSVSVWLPFFPRLLVCVFVHRALVPCFFAFLSHQGCVSIGCRVSDAIVCVWRIHCHCCVVRRR